MRRNRKCLLSVPGCLSWMTHRLGNTNVAVHGREYDDSVLFLNINYGATVMLD